MDLMYVIYSIILLLIFLLNIGLIDKIVDAHNENNLKKKWILIYCFSVINMGTIIYLIK